MHLSSFPSCKVTKTKNKLANFALLWSTKNIYNYSHDITANLQHSHTDGEHFFCPPTFLCFLCQWPPASRAEESQWGRMRCPPGWGCLSSPLSYCRHRWGHRNPYLKHTESSLKCVSLLHALKHKESKGEIARKLHVSSYDHCKLH